MFVYRIEHENNGLGPYYKNTHYDEDWYINMINKHDQGNSHPNLNEDALYGTEYEPVFGFDSIDKLIQWFDGFLIDLIQAGYIIKKYLAGEYKLGISGKQLVFNRTTKGFNITTKVLHKHQIK